MALERNVEVHEINNKTTEGEPLYLKSKEITLTGNRTVVLKLCNYILNIDAGPKVQETRQVFGISIKGPRGAYFYKTVDSPMLHISKINSKKLTHNSTLNEANVIKELGDIPRSSRNRIGFVRSLLEARITNEDGINITEHIETGIGGRRLDIALKMLEKYIRRGGGIILSSHEARELQMILFLNAMESLENFNLAQFQHEHPHTANFIVNENGRIYIIDYSVAHKSSRRESSNIALYGVSDILQFGMYLLDYQPYLLSELGITKSLKTRLYFFKWKYSLVKLNPANVERILNPLVGDLKERIKKFLENSDTDNLVENLEKVLIEEALSEIGYSNVTQDDIMTVSEAIKDLISEADTIIYN